jgi:hypothetical protein
MTVSFDTGRTDSLKVEEILGGGRNVPAVARAISEDEIMLEGANPEMTPEQRYVWLRMKLGDTSTTISALGEIVDMGPDVRRIRFKHIFPDYKKMLHDYISKNASIN